MRALWSDLQFALRSMRRAPFWTCAVVLALSAGIGLNAGVSSMIRGYLFYGPDEKDPNTFVEPIPRYSGWFPEENRFLQFTFQDFDALRTQSHSLTDIAAFNPVEGPRLPNGRANLAFLVTCNIFSLFGIERPVLGRLFLPDDCRAPGESPIVVINEDLWRREYAADPAITGKVLHINRQQYTVVGISPANFSGPMKYGVWIPIAMEPKFYNGDDAFQDPSWPWLNVMARLKPGRSHAEARAELSLIMSRQDRLIPGRRTVLLLTNGSFMENPLARSRGILTLSLAMGPMVLILLVACTNVMILLLSKGVARKGEIAVRLALGAGRTRLLRMLATEGAIVAIAAGAISVYLAYRVPTVLWAYLVKAGDYQAKKPDWAVFAYLAGLSLLAACIAGLAPARESLKIDLVSALKGLGGTHTRRSRSQSILVVAQIAVSFLLVVACVFLTRVQHRITSVSPGFETRHVFFIPLDIRAPAYSENSERSIYQTLEERLQQLPGVQSVSYASLVPFKQTGSGLEKLRLPGDAREQGRQGSVDIVSKDFFSTLGIPIVRGRGFEHADVTSQASTPVAIVSQSLAHSFWDGQDAIGKLIVMPDNRQVRIVGVARDTRSEVYGVLDGPRLYVLRDPRSFGGTLMVRFEGDERSLSGSIETTVKTVDAEQIVVPQTLQSVVDEASDMFGRVTKLVVLLAGGASALALIGVFGIVSISVSRRTREFGMRTVLGASNRHIILSGLGSGARQVTLGVLFGFALAIPAMAVWERLAKGSPFQTNIFDPSVYIIATVLLFAVALGAIYVPVRRAANMDPVAALRYE